MNLQTTIYMNAGWSATKTGANDISSSSQTVAQAFTISMADGTTTGLNDLMYQNKQRNVADAASVSYDLSGALTDVFGDTISFVRVKGIYVVNRSMDASLNNTLTEIGIDGNFITTAFGASADIPLDAGTATNPGVFLWLSPDVGQTVTNATADTITITNNDGTGNAADWDIVVWGATA